MEYNCNICNKKYSSYKSLWFHNYKYHKPNVNINQVDVNTNVNINSVDVNINKHNCKHCNKAFTTRQSKSRHEIHYCDKKNELNNKKIIEELKKENEEKTELIKLLQKSLKIHPKSLNKINNQLINNQLVNNGTINNTINIVQLGHENLSEVLSRNQKINILNRQAMSINDLVELVHVSSRYTQFKNVYITNLQSSYGYMYSEKLQKFITVNKNDLINDILDSRMYDIEKFYEEVYPKMDPDKADRIKHFINRMTNDKDKMKGLKKEEIKLILYNNKETIMNIKDAILNENNKELEL